MNGTTQFMAVPLATAHVIEDQLVVKSSTRLPLSEQAQVEVEGKMVDYNDNLVEIAEKIAKRHKADGVSAADVTQAANEMVNCPRRNFYTHLGVCGGLFVGAALSHLLEMTYHGRFSAASTVVTCLLFVVGGVMLGVNAVMEK